MSLNLCDLSFIVRVVKIKIDAISSYLLQQIARGLFIVLRLRQSYNY